jgi:hypothetical protein
LEKNLKKGIKRIGKLWEEKITKNMLDLPEAPNMREENSDLRGTDLFSYSNETQQFVFRFKKPYSKAYELSGVPFYSKTEMLESSDPGPTKG